MEPVQQTALSTEGFHVAYVTASVQLTMAPGTRVLQDSKRWQMALMSPPFFVQPSKEAGALVTHYNASAHPARSVTFGGPVSCLIYPTGKIIAHGRCKEEEAKQHAVKAAELTVRCLEGRLSQWSPPKIENLVITCPRLLEVQAQVDADMLWMDKTAVRLGAQLLPSSEGYEEGGSDERGAVVEFCPEVAPGTLGIRVPSASHGTAKTAALAVLLEDGNITIHGVASVASAVEAYLWVWDNVVRVHANGLGQGIGPAMDEQPAARHETGRKRAKEQAAAEKDEEEEEEEED